MIIQDPDTLTPAARALHDRYRVMIDQGKVCPLCGADLVVVWPVKGGEDDDGELWVGIQCSENRPDTGETCDWHLDPADEEMIVLSSDYEVGRACQLHGGCLGDCCE